ncbi:hypothetical protein FH972_022339 [Carpinus fangiana]|uniref:Uncharacterized protein n=1 Tax=Carpinus fangiana TaxID=176857 RepID=A0A5N6KSJ0_9ROSI|nr:hypothetical protein FH972_022339 [Carpinus fangiana]
MVAYRLNFAAAATVALAATSVSASPVKRADTSGCGISHNNGYNTNGGAGFPLESSGGQRSYTVRVPDGYDANRQYPLIVDYHGNGGSSDSQYGNSRYDQYDEGRTNFIAVYPQGLDGHWEGAGYADKGVSDLQFTTDLVQHMRENYCIDSARIYASGKSNGGGFVGTLACDPAGGDFAAFGMASAALYTDNLGDTARECKPARPSIPILESHGTADTTISYDGGEGYGGALPAIPAWLNAWGVRDGCADQAVVNTDQGNGVTVSEYSCNGVNNIVTGYKIEGLGHCWPVTGASNSDSGKDNCGNSPIDYTPIVLDFFNAWNINGAI